jgi:hypothetical protein
LVKDLGGSTNSNLLISQKIETRFGHWDRTHRMRFLKCNFENDKKMIAWSPGKGMEVPHVANPCPKFAITLGEQMEEALTEWYNALGKSVPPEELQACRDVDAAAEVELATEKMAALTMAPAKPVYGTPEFWKDYWARKKAGLVPNTQAKVKKQKSSVPGSAKSSAPA